MLGRASTTILCYGTSRFFTFVSRAYTKATSGSPPVNINVIVEAAVKRTGLEIVNGLEAKGWAEINSFLGDVPALDLMREEAVAMYEGGRLRVSQSTKWAVSSGTLEYYDKQNVFSTSMKEADGGDNTGGRVLHGYAVAIARSLGQVVATRFPEASLSITPGTGLRESGAADNSSTPLNKLSVCTGSGSSYEPHYDNINLEDRRKLTVLIYLNRGWRAECGGWFRIHNPPPGSKASILVEPREDTLLVFWADQLVHSVMPSQVPFGNVDNRYAFTVWLTASSTHAIIRDKSAMAAHFGS